MYHQADGHATVTEMAHELSEHRPASSVCPVQSYNEWDPLEEVIVGRLEGATLPTNHVAVTFNIPPRFVWLYRRFAGRRYPKIFTQAAQ